MSTATDPFPWVCVDGDHRYSAALNAADAKAGGLLYDPRPALPTQEDE